MKPFLVYILRCGDGSYYTGHTDDMTLRMQQHEHGLVGYTATRKPLQLRWQGEFETREAALAFEQQVKGWSRAKKEALMAGDWNRVQVLARSQPGNDPAPQPHQVELPQPHISVRPELVEGHARRLRQAQPERLIEAQPKRAIEAQPERVIEARPERVIEAQPERAIRARAERVDEVHLAGPQSPHSVRPELVEGHARRLRQAQPERLIEAQPERLIEAQPERLIEAQPERLIRARAERVDEVHFAGPQSPHSVRPELVEGHARRLRQAQPERLIEAQPERVIEAELERVEGAQPERPAASHPERTTGQLVSGVLKGQRRAVAKAITLLESTRADHRAQADELLSALLPHTGKAFRLGLSGVPGVGKSTFIEALGLHLIEDGHRVAVLTIDPSSSVSGGSILGDKTRMERLSVQELAYVRPSPSSGTLGGVAEKTREAMLVCEAAGYDVVIVETVGVGQSETAVAGMTDMFVLMQLPNAGDDLQAIKKGVMELADLVVINKADLDADAATRAQAQITSALRLFSPCGRGPGAWLQQVLQLSAVKGTGVDAFWAAVSRFRSIQTAEGRLQARRRQQARAWMWERIEAGLKQDFRQHPAVRALLPQLAAEVEAGRVAASTAARRLLTARHPPTVRAEPACSTGSGQAGSGRTQT